MKKLQHLVLDDSRLRFMKLCRSLLFNKVLKHKTTYMSDPDLFESDDEYENHETSADTYTKDVTSRTSVDNLEDCDIIPETPPASTKKKKLRKPLHRSAQNKYAKWTIDKTKTGVLDFNKPYVYLDVDEILRYTSNYLPKYNNIHLVGVHKFNSADGHFLVSLHSKVTVALDFTVSAKVPASDDDVISVFGSVELSNKSTFVVNFFRNEVEVAAGKYVQSLKVLRNFIPTNYLATTCNDLHIKYT